MFLTIDDLEIENELKNLNLFNRMGSWKDKFLNVSYHLVKEDNGYRLVKEFDDRSFRLINVTFENCKNHCIFTVPESPSDEFFVLTGNVLEIRDKLGLIDTYEPFSNS